MAADLVREVEAQVTLKVTAKLRDIVKGGGGGRLHGITDDCKKDLQSTLAVVASSTTEVNNTQATGVEIETVQKLKQSAVSLVNILLDCEACGTALERVAKNAETWTPTTNMEKEFDQHVTDIVSKRPPTMAENHPYYKKHKKAFEKNVDDDDVEIEGGDNDDDPLAWKDPVTKDGPEDVQIIPECGHRLNKKTAESIAHKRPASCPIRGCKALLMTNNGKKLYEPDVLFAENLIKAQRRKAAGAITTTTAPSTSSSSKRNRNVATDVQ